MSDLGQELVVKRVYEPAADEDGTRVLVDRLWPRGVSKERAKLDLWLKEIAPSPLLRKEFAHMQDRFADFKSQYLHELSQAPEQSAAVDLLLAHVRNGEHVTLLYGAKNPDVNHAIVLSEFLRARLAS
ncbi:DUF488 domain-containing protein [Pseudarthrobacter sp. J1738]|uniref:DUF488 domain-containing protein n=1 Tax=unclassified Pseudarthrobacter TaxID=2647000 RepID=UPI003D2AE9AC